MENKTNPPYARRATSPMSVVDGTGFGLHPGESSRLRLAAIDLDGTLLGPDLSISAGNLRAVEKLQAANLEVVIASGRHYSSILPFAARLPGVRWLVSAQGGEVSDVGRSVVLHRDFLPPSRLEAVVDLGERLAFAAMFYTPDGIRTNTTSPQALAFYAQLAGVAPVVVDSGALERARVHKVVWIGTVPAIEALASNVQVADLGLQTVRTHLRLFELMPIGVTKASGLAVLARHLGMDAGQVVAFGDADNDIPMFAWAHESVAMPHGWPAALRAARVIGPPGGPEDALARAVDLVVDR